MIRHGLPLSHHGDVVHCQSHPICGRVWAFLLLLVFLIRQVFKDLIAGDMYSKLATAWVLTTIAHTMRATTPEFHFVLHTLSPLRFAYKKNTHGTQTP